MKTSRIVALAILFLAAVGAAGAQVAGRFASVVGKVEYQAPSGAWKAVKVGDAIAPGGMVSVGFKSSAVIKTADAEITVKALTRLSIEDIVTTAGGTRTTLRLGSGSIHTEVAAPTGTKSAFSVRSPTATASVRGTGFEFDGRNLSVLHGAVDLRNARGQRRKVGAGYASAVLSSGLVSAPFIAPPGGLSGLSQKSNELDRGDQGIPFMGRNPDSIAEAARLPATGLIVVDIPID